MDTEYERARRITHIAYNIERSAPATMDNPTVVIGKGAIDCESGKILCALYLERRMGRGTTSQSMISPPSGVAP